MKKIALMILILIFLTGCGGLYNLNNFILPNDLEFLALIVELDTPEKICQYMENNFEYEPDASISLDPYELFITKKGDCNDYTAFAIFVANWHGYETYQLFLKYAAYVYGYPVGHTMAVFKEEDCYNICEVACYKKGCWETFKGIAEHFIGWTYYKIFDYDMNIIEQGYNS